MKERLEPFRGRPSSSSSDSQSMPSSQSLSLSVQPHEMRGTYDECRFWAKIINRTSIDDDPHRSTGKVSIDVRNTGLTFIPGDRLAIMPLNSWTDIEVSSTLDRAVRC